MEVTRRRIQPYERLKTISLEEGFMMVRLGAAMSSIYAYGVKINVRSNRLVTFLRKGVQCSYPDCTLKGSYFAIERSPTKNLAHAYHLNMWGVTEDGQEVLFTHDHICAEGLGGSRFLENTATMCCWHNWQKGEFESMVAKMLKGNL